MGECGTTSVIPSERSESRDLHPATSFAELESRPPTAAVDAAHATVGPDTIAKVLFTSGYSEQPVQPLNGIEARILNKPYRRSDLASMLRSVLKGK